MFQSTKYYLWHGWSKEIMLLLNKIWKTLNNILCFCLTMFLSWAAMVNHLLISFMFSMSVVQLTELLHSFLQMLMESNLFQSKQVRCWVFRLVKIAFLLSSYELILHITILISQLVFLLFVMGCGSSLTSRKKVSHWCGAKTWLCLL